MATLKNKELTLDGVVLKVANFPSGSNQVDVFAALQSLYNGIEYDYDIPCFGYYNTAGFNRMRRGTYNDQPAFLCDFDSTNIVTFVNDSKYISYDFKILIIR